MALAVVALLVLLLRIVPLVRSHGRGEAVCLQNAPVVLDGRDNDDEFYYRPPLISCAYALGFRIRDSLHSAHVVQGFLALVPVIGASLIASGFAGRRVRRIAATLFALTPHIVKMPHRLQAHAPAVGLTLASIRLFERRGRLGVALSGTVYGAAILMRYKPLTLAEYFLAVAALSRQRVRDRVPRAIGPAVVLALCLL